VPRDPVVDALVAEVDQALIALQTARRLIADLQRSDRAAGRARRSASTSTESSLPPSLRYTGMTVAEAAAALRVSEEHVRRMLRRGQLLGIQFGGRIGWRLAREHVAEMAASLDRQVLGQKTARLPKPSKSADATGRRKRNPTS
jgi:excisionase family DNA binding protein